MTIHHKALEAFAQNARRQLMAQVGARLEQVLNVDSVEIREQAAAVLKLQEQIRAASREAVIEQAAYTWFNRFIALCFMDVNGYTAVGVVSPREGHTQPEILAEAKQGVVDPALPVDKGRVFDLLNGRIPSRDPQTEAYRALLVAECNRWHDFMPFLFEKIADYTELLLPEDLLSEGSLLEAARRALTSEACRDVEVIGWLYQYYISEKKDQVIGSKDKIVPEDIPAATQLFTPHWIVRYLVENSLGRLWMQSHPESHLRDRMDYYIAPEEKSDFSEKSDFCLRIDSPEEIRLLDPACGSGHMLTYAFDLLYAIYEEQGYDPPEIPRLILEKNLYGIEIDPRAGALAAFALTMKARAKDRRFFRRSASSLRAKRSNPLTGEETASPVDGLRARSDSQTVRPNILVMENVTFTPDELAAYKKALGPDLFTQPLWETLGQFEEAQTFGALIRPVERDAAGMRRLLEEKGAGMDLFLHKTHEKVLRVLEMAATLSPRYHVVVANPPYMGGRNMNPELKEFAKDRYPDSKSDLFAMFIERNAELARAGGFVGMITMQSWMFLSSFEKLRAKLLDQETILSMAHLGPRAFDTISGEVVSTTAFVLAHARNPRAEGLYLRLVDGQSEAEKEALFRASLPTPHSPRPTNTYRARAADFKKIPGAPIAYWVSERVREVFEKGIPLEKIASPRQGLATADNARFLRLWHEVASQRIGFGMKSREEAKASDRKWFPCNKGGTYRKWYGNGEYVVNWESDGKMLFSFRPKSVIRNPQYYFREGITWSTISSSKLSMRYSPPGMLFETKGSMCFADDENDLVIVQGMTNSIVAFEMLKAISPTLDFHEGPLGKLPIMMPLERNFQELIRSLRNLARQDWDDYETSWDFSALPLLRSEYRGETLAATYASLRRAWQATTLEMQRLEEENNRVFIEAYGLQEELSPEVPLAEITLTCNPYYRYSSLKRVESGQWGVGSGEWAETLESIAARNAAAEGDDPARARALELRLLEDTMKEFISYAVGCMFGRYSLDKPGLILANQGEGIEDFRLKIADLGLSWDEVRFPPDEDNVIPVIGGNWFPDDITERFKRFLKVTFGEARYDDNLRFIETALGKEIEAYFLKDFYKDHVRRYKKRPIYWLFSSAKGSFQALIYMHRYRPETVSVVLDYLRAYRRKLEGYRAAQEHLSVSGTRAERPRALKEIARVDKILLELKDYEERVLYPLAGSPPEIDLDDGVKVNYPKFGAALKGI